MEHFDEIHLNKRKNKKMMSTNQTKYSILHLSDFHLIDTRISAANWSKITKAYKDKFEAIIKLYPDKDGLSTISPEHLFPFCKRRM